MAIACLRPTIPEHDIHRHQHADMHLVLLLAGQYVSDAAGMPAVCAEPAVIFNPPGTEHRDRFRSLDGLFLLPEKQAVVVITTTNYNEQQPHLLTFRLLTRDLLPAMADVAPALTK